MRRLLGSLAALTAALVGGCFDDRGVALVVDVGEVAGVDSVELFIATRACASSTEKIDCDALTPPSAAVPVPGTIWIRDADASLFALVNGTKATLRLEPPADTDAMTLPRVFVIGRDAAGAPLSVHAFEDLEVSSDPRLLELALTPTQGALGATQPVSRPAGEYVQLWGSCLAIEHRTDDGVTRDFVVPADDPDCDGRPTTAANECNPTAADGAQGIPSSAEAEVDCLVAKQGVCFVGYTGCKDGVADEGCYPAARPMCAPAATCATCDNKPDRNCFEGIATTKAQHVTCTLHPTVQPCSASTPVSLERYLPDGCGDRPTIATITNSSADQFAFGDSATFETGTVRVDAPGTASGGCALKLTWTRGTPQGGESIEYGAIKLGNDRGTALLPIVIANLTPAADCAEAFACTVSNPGGELDPMWACVAP